MMKCNREQFISIEILYRIITYGYKIERNISKIYIYLNFYIGVNEYLINSLRKIFLKKYKKNIRNGSHER